MPCRVRYIAREMRSITIVEYCSVLAGIRDTIVSSLNNFAHVSLRTIDFFPKERRKNGREKNRSSKRNALLSLNQCVSKLGIITDNSRGRDSRMVAAFARLWGGAVKSD